MKVVKQTPSGGENPFSKWLKRMEGKEIRVSTTKMTYDGMVIMVEKELCVLRERNMTYVFRLDDIEYVSGDDKAFKFKSKVNFKEIEDKS